MMEKLFKNKIFVFLACGVFVWWKYGKMGIITIDKALFFAMLVFGFLTLVSAYDKAWKYESPQVVCANDHGSTDMRMIPAGENYVLIKKGGILTGGWHMEGSEGTWILPRRFVSQGENVIMSPIVVEETALVALPPSVYETLVTNDQYKPPYLYGEIPLGILSTGDETVDELYNQIKALQRQVNWYQDRVSDLTQEIDRYMSHTYRITDRKKWYQLLVGKNEGENND